MLSDEMPKPITTEIKPFKPALSDKLEPYLPIKPSHSQLLSSSET